MYLYIYNAPGKVDAETYLEPSRISLAFSRQLFSQKGSI